MNGLSFLITNQTKRNPVENCTIYYDIFIYLNKENCNHSNNIIVMDVVLNKIPVGGSLELYFSKFTQKS